MLTVITDARKVRAATKALRDQLRAAAEKPLKHTIGFPGGQAEGKVWVLREHGFFWCALGEGDPENRSWNGFGHVMPDERPILPLDVEVNVPWEGINRRVAGVFLEGPGGEVYLGHRGRIGGGRKGVGKSAFWSAYRDQARTVVDDDQTAEIVLLGRVGAPKLLTDLATFIHNVVRIKLEATGMDADGEHEPSGEVDIDPLAFSPEFEGTKSISITKTIEAQCHHGTIVRQLRDALVDLGWKAGNDRARDLVGHPPDAAAPVTFEVKTDVSSQSIYAGVGQLVMHARPTSTGARAILVVPDDLTQAAELVLVGEGIAVLRYRWVDDRTIDFAKLADVVVGGIRRRKTARRS